MTKKENEFIETMKRTRGIEFARIGMMVCIDGDIGTIVGSNDSACLDVVFANKLKHGKFKHNCHPTYKITYFGKDGETVAEF